MNMDEPTPKRRKTAISSKSNLLLIWFEDHGGYLHPSVEVAENDDFGLHFKANEPIAAGTTVCSCPLDLSLSYRDALVGDVHLNFEGNNNARMRARWARGSKNKPFSNQVIAYLFLAYQYRQGAGSKWYPYIRTLPQPGPEKDREELQDQVLQEWGHLPRDEFREELDEVLENYPLEDRMPSSELTTSLCFNKEDAKWFMGSEVEFSTKQRKEAWRAMWEETVEGLRDQGWTDVAEELPVNIFMWAASIFSSRSFSSKAAGVTGADQEPYALLFPVFDIGNHSPHAKVGWEHDGSAFKLVVDENLEAGSQVFNNYAPKPNDELLMGYGFCIERNPADVVRLRLRTPDEKVSAALSKIRQDQSAPTEEHGNDQETGNGNLNFDLKESSETGTTSLRLLDILQYPYIQNLPRDLVNNLMAIASVMQDIAIPVYTGYDSTFTQPDAATLAYLREIPDFAELLEDPVVFETIINAFDDHLHKQEEPRTSPEFWPLQTRLEMTLGMSEVLSAALEEKRRKLIGDGYWMKNEPQNVKQKNAKIYMQGQLDIFDNLLRYLEETEKQINEFCESDDDEVGQMRAVAMEVRNIGYVNRVLKWAKYEWKP